MSFNRFEPDTLIYIDGSEYRPLGYSAGRLQFQHTVTGALYTCADGTGIIGYPTDETFGELYGSGRLKILSAKTTDPVRLHNEASQWAIAQAMEIDDGVAKMLAQCDILDDAGVPNGDKAIQAFLAIHWNEPLVAKYGPHAPPRTIRYWRSNRGRASRRHARDMVRLNRVGGTRPGVDDVAHQLLWKHAATGWSNKLTIKEMYAEYIAELTRASDGRHPLISKPDVPYEPLGKRTMRRAFNAMESSTTVAAKHGKAVVEQDWQGGGRVLTADFALHRVIIDHTPLDVFVVDDEFEMVLGRPWLTLAIDVRTRAIVAWLITFIDPCAWTVGEILRRMVLPKRPPPEMAARYPILRNIRGRPMEIVVDNAPEFRSHTMEAAARSARIGIRFCPIKRPRYRAVGERAIGTFTDQICRLLPGRVLSPAETRRFGHEPEAGACVLMNELEAIANMAAAIYNTERHDGIGGRQPALLFEHEINRNGIMNFTDFDSFRIDTMVVVPNVQLSSSGIRTFDGLRYHDAILVPKLLDDLRPLEPRRARRDTATATVEFRYDPMDIGKIYVWNRRTRTYVELVCDDERYAEGMPLWFHEQIRSHAQAQSAAFNTSEERQLMRAKLVQAIREINPEAKKKERALVARLLEIPRLRQMTGNIVDLVQVEAEPVSLGQFIASDRIEPTALDDEILSSRPPFRKRDPNRALKDRRDAHQTSTTIRPSPTRVTSSRPAVTRGGYK